MFVELKDSRVKTDTSGARSKSIEAKERKSGANYHINPESGDLVKHFRNSSTSNDC